MALATAVGLSEGGGVGKRTIWWLASFGKGLIRCKVWTGKQGDHFLWKACIPIKKASSNFMVAEAHHLLQSPSPIHAKRFSMFAEIKGWKLLRDNIYQLISTFLMLEYHVTHEIHFEIPKTLCHWVSLAPQEERYDPIVPVQLRQMPVRQKRKRILVHEVRCLWRHWLGGFQQKNSWKFRQIYVQLNLFQVCWTGLLFETAQTPGILYAVGDRPCLAISAFKRGMTTGLQLVSN